MKHLVIHNLWPLKEADVELKHINVIVVLRVQAKVVC